MHTKYLYAAEEVYPLRNTNRSVVRVSECQFAPLDWTKVTGRLAMRDLTGPCFGSAVVIGGRCCAAWQMSVYQTVGGGGGRCLLLYRNKCVYFLLHYA